MNIKIAIADNNIEYAQKVFDVLTKDDRFTAALFTGVDSLAEALRTRRYDIVLFDKSMIVSELKLIPLPILIVDDEDTDGLEQFASFSKINKFQRISRIINCTLELYSEIAPEIAMNDSGKVRVSAVYSPIGGSGKTTIACAAAKVFGYCGKKALYISFEQFPSSEIIFDDNDGKGIGELFTTLKGNANFSLKLQSLIHDNNGVMVISPFKNARDIEEISTDEITELINRIVSSGICDNLIIDMDSTLSPFNRAVMESANEIFVITTPDNISQLKYNKLLGDVDFSSKNGDKVREIVNKCTGNYNDGKLRIKRLSGNSELDICNYLATSGELTWLMS